MPTLLRFATPSAASTATSFAAALLALAPALAAAQASAPEDAASATRGPAAPPSTRFDGNWGVHVDCAQTESGAMGYTLDLEARIENGALKGERGQEGQVGYLKIDGRVRADGALTLVARGNTGDSKNSAGSVPIRSPYAYRAAGRLEPTRGEARRLDTRPCTLALTKR